MTALWVSLRSTLRQAAVISGWAAAVVVTQAQDTNPTAATVAAFQQRLKDYMAVHDKAAKGLPSPTREATPAEVVKHQRELETRLLPMRKAAKPGDVFTPDMQAFLRKYLAQLFSGADGAKLKAAVMDENPVYVKYGVNSRYPDTVPLSTMPAQVLKVLPPLPEGLEYRFIGRDLILLDVRAHLVVDFVRNVIPA